MKVYHKEIPVSILKGKSKVVFTNGCFDILHPGHLHLINQANTLGDFLIVAVNSDTSVSRLKGKERPHQNIEIRVKALSELKEVGAIVIFEDDTPIHLLEKLRPQVYIKGADYKGKSFPEADLVRSYGGDVVFITFLEGYSTTDILARGKQK